MPLRSWVGALVLVLLAPACGAGTRAPIGPSGGPAQPAAGGTVRAYHLTAEPARLQLKPGVQVQAWTYNGTVPGPTLRARAGDLVRVTLDNRLPEGTTIHWHGLVLPNGEDGVAGVTQDPVPPGRSATYSFVVNQAGTYWYHSHQSGAAQVDRGLYGALVVEPREDPHPAATDATLVYDEWPLALERASPPAPTDFEWVSDVTDSVNGRAGAAIAPVRFRSGGVVRLRLVNAGNFPHLIRVEGAAPTITAFDGHEVFGGPPVDQMLPLGPAERIDIEFPGPDHPVWLRLLDGLPPAAETVVPVLPLGVAEPPVPAAPEAAGPALDIYRYPANAHDSPWPAGAVPTKSLDLVLSAVAVQGGSPSLDDTVYEIDGKTFPDTPVPVVSVGDLVEVTFRNTSGLDHSMHLHGHFFQVLAEDGAAPPGVIVKDTVLVGPHQTITVGFRADNPGWWMLHCHELYHSRGGMMMLLRYRGARRLAELGGPYGGRPD